MPSIPADVPLEQMLDMVLDSVTHDNVDGRVSHVLSLLAKRDDRSSPEYHQLYRCYMRLKQWMVDNAHVQWTNPAPPQGTGAASAAAPPPAAAASAAAPPPAAASAAAPPPGAAPQQNTWGGFQSGPAPQRSHFKGGKGKGYKGKSHFVPPVNRDPHCDLDWIANRDITPSGINAPPMYPETPLGRLQDIGDESVPFYERRMAEQAMTEAREWETVSHLGDWDQYWAPVLTQLGIDQESRAMLALLRQTSLEGHREACRLIAHLIRKRHQVRNPSRWVQTDIHAVRNWLDRPPFEHPDFENFLRRRGWEGGAPPILAAAPAAAAAAAAPQQQPQPQPAAAAAAPQQQPVPAPAPQLFKAPPPQPAPAPAPQQQQQQQVKAAPPQPIPAPAPQQQQQHAKAPPPQPTPAPAPQQQQQFKAPPPMPAPAAAAPAPQPQPLQPAPGPAPRTTKPPPQLAPPLAKPPPPGVATPAASPRQPAAAPQDAPQRGHKAPPPRPADMAPAPQQAKPAPPTPYGPSPDVDQVPPPFNLQDWLRPPAPQEQQGAPQEQQGAPQDVPEEPQAEPRPQGLPIAPQELQSDAPQEEEPHSEPQNPVLARLQNDFDPQMYTTDEPPEDYVLMWDWRRAPPDDSTNALLSSESPGWNWCAVNRAWWFGYPGWWWVVSYIDENGEEIFRSEWHPVGQEPAPRVWL